MRQDVLKLNEKRQCIIDAFLQNYKAFGCREELSVPITSGIDSTVTFIGSAISVMKPYIKNNSIPENGLVLAQDSIRTQNLSHILNDDFYINWASFFTNISSIVPYSLKNEALECNLRFFYDFLKVAKKDLVLRVNSMDEELYALCRKYVTIEQLEINTNVEYYYRHSIGINGLNGRNFNFAIKHRKTGQYMDVGNYIIFYDEYDVPMFIEMGFGNTTILRLLEGYEHVLDCFPFVNFRVASDQNRRKIQDLLITTMVLMREGLNPSTSNGQTKILSRYIKCLLYFLESNDLYNANLDSFVEETEERIFGNTRSSNQLIFALEQKKHNLEKDERLRRKNYHE